MNCQVFNKKSKPGKSVIVALAVPNIIVLNSIKDAVCFVVVIDCYGCGRPIVLSRIWDHDAVVRTGGCTRVCHKNACALY